MTTKNLTLKEWQKYISQESEVIALEKIRSRPDFDLLDPSSKKAIVTSETRKHKTLVKIGRLKAISKMERFTKRLKK